MLKNAVSAGAERRRIGPSLRTLFSAASMGGRAAWPTVRLTCGKERSGAAPRGHARDDFSRSTDRENESEKVFIKNLQDVAHSSFELYPENSVLTLRRKDKTVASE